MRRGREGDRTDMTEAGIAKLEREGDNEDTETTKADPSPERGRRTKRKRYVSTLHA